MSNYKLVLDKLALPKAHLDSEDLSPNQKKTLYEVMMKHGASQGFAYDRFFKEGFREWELKGIEKVKSDFLSEHKEDIPADDDSSSLNFYDLIGRARLKLVFIDYMALLGMGANAVIDRFGKAGESDFREYERIGIRAVVREFFNELEEKQIV